jgi:2-polyprenyl-3-methyl-5-hydroxy-6-metoxy-1,4-benzoquinol methylase
MISFLNAIISKIVEFIVKKPFVQKKVKGEKAKKIIELYSTTPYTRNFVKFRFWFGPVLEIDKLTPTKGLILDIGSGEGILANYLALSSTKRKIIGIELNKSRIKEASKGLKNIKFINGSALTTKLPKADAIVVSHVFHHLGTRKRQEDLIEKIYQTLKPKGKLIIGEVDREFSLRYLFGYIVDIILVPIFFEKKFLDLKIFHRGKREWKKLLEDKGFKVIYQKNTIDRIYPEVLYVATR